jgi:hypothetical protein
MPYVPSPNEVRRLKAALDRAAFTEVERIFWLVGFAGLLMLEGFLLASARTWVAIGVGALGVFGAFALLYWRLRGGHLSTEDRELHGIGLRTESQRAFTGLMFRQVLTGRNPLQPRTDHDPYAAWSQRVERSEAAPVEEA